MNLKVFSVYISIYIFDTQCFGHDEEEERFPFIIQKCLDVTIGAMGILFANVAIVRHDF